MEENQIVIEDSFESKDLLKKPKTICKIGTLGAILVAAITLFGLFLDYSCTNAIVPVNYIHSRKLIAANNESESSYPTSSYQCQNDQVCGHGTCKIASDIRNVPYGSHCNCNDQYITVPDQGVCEYQQLVGTVALLLSIFVGGCGIDRCFLARGNGCGICLGILKGMTAGGLGIWYIFDIVKIATNNLQDGNGQYPTLIQCC